MRVSCLILARGGSKGIPNKNCTPFCGMPLIYWTISQALNCKSITDVWVSSDSDEILSVSESFGAKIINRPTSLADDTSSSESAWLHALQVVEQKSSELVDYVVAPQVTSPLRHSSDFNDALDTIKNQNADSLLTVAEVEDYFCWKLQNKQLVSVSYDYTDRKPRQLLDKTYLENGSFYIFKPSILREYGNRLGGRIACHRMDRYKMFQIDDPDDLKLCETVMKGFGLNEL